jgi:hypothetical protein
VPDNLPQSPQYWVERRTCQLADTYLQRILWVVVLMEAHPTDVDSALPLLVAEHMNMSQPMVDEAPPPHHLYSSKGQGKHLLCLTSQLHLN